MNDLVMWTNALYFLIAFLFFSGVTAFLFWEALLWPLRQPSLKKTWFMAGTTLLKPFSGRT